MKETGGPCRHIPIHWRSNKAKDADHPFRKRERAASKSRRTKSLKTLPPFNCKSPTIPIWSVTTTAEQVSRKPIRRPQWAAATLRGVRTALPATSQTGWHLCASPPGPAAQTAPRTNPASSGDRIRMTEDAPVATIFPHHRYGDC